MREGNRGDIAPSRVLGYARVSSLEQEARGTSLDGQREELVRFCRERGYPAPLLFVETESGGGTGEARLEQLRLMSMVGPGDLVIVAKQDRWSRSVLHFLGSVDEIMKRGGRFFSLAERFDPNTHEGRFAMSIMAGVAELERSRIHDRTAGARRRLRRSGHWVEGRPPTGYRRDDAARKLVPDEATAPIVRAMFRLCLEGRSTRQISAELTSRHPDVPGLDGQAIGRRLRDRRYLGEMPAAGRSDRSMTAPEIEWLQGTHEPLIDVVTWRQVQDRISERTVGGRPPAAASPAIAFLLRGLARCALCGYAISARATSPSSRHRHSGHYVCASVHGARSCPGVYARQDQVDAEVSRQLLARLEELAEVLSRPLSSPPPAPTDEPMPDFRGDRSAIARRKANLLEAIADGTITRADAREKLRGLEAQLADVERREIAYVAQHTPAAVPDRLAELAQVEAMRETWAALDTGERRELLELLTERIELGPNPATPKGSTVGRWVLTIRWRA